MSMVPVVASAEELPDAITYANDRQPCRYWVARRAAALGRADLIPESWGEATITAATAPGSLSADQLAALGKKGQALKNSDGTYSYPTRNRGELAKAIQAFGRARNKVAAKRYILRRARALHATDLIPDSWRPIRAAVDGADEVALWVQQVRDLLTEEGVDPDEVEAGTDGFEADFREFADKPDVYVAELVEAFTGPDDDETDEDPADEETPVTAPETIPVADTAPPVVPVAAAGMTYNVYTSSPPQAPPAAFDMAAMTAAIRDAAKEAVAEAMAAAADVPVDPAPDPDVTDEADADPAEESAAEPATPEDTPPEAPVDLAAAKQALRDRFNRTPAPAADPTEVPVAAAVTAAAMRERIASLATG